MADESGFRTAFNKPTTRRALLAGTAGVAGAGSLAYLLGDRFLLDTENSDPEPSTASDPGAGRPTPSPTTEVARLGHLLRRAGFGATREEFDRYMAMGLDAATGEIVNYQDVSDDEAEAVAGQLDLEGRNIGPAIAWWLTRMANTRRPLQEKMTLFWHGLLTSQISVVRDPLAMVAQNEFLRTNAMGALPDILKGIGRDPAMMVYLDIAGSQSGSPNENYARELMELFSLGVGNFSEDDVREASRAFTGWVVPRRRSDDGRPTLLEPRFVPLRYDGGAKTVLGQIGDFGPDEIVDIIVEQPESASFITTRLFEFFVYPNPEPEALAPFVSVYTSSGRSIGATVEAMLRSEVFYSERAYRALIKSPVEYAVGAIKALGQQQELGQALLAGGGRRDGGLLGQMGQIPFEPPNVAGWPGGASWLNSSSVFARLNLIDALTGGPPSRVRDRRDVPAPDISNHGTAEQALEYFLPLLLDDEISSESRDLLLTYSGVDGETELTSEQLRDLVYLMLASPEYHLA